MRLALVLLAALVWAGQGQAEEVRLGPLAGTLLRPVGQDQPPVVLILPGSGPTDRNGDQPGLNSGYLRQLAEGLAEAGIASLRADKRGVGASAAGAPSEADLRFETYVADARGWMALLAARGDLGSILLLGHSEGALIATLALEAGGGAGLILLAGAGERADRLIAAQLAAAGLPLDLQAASAAIAAALRDGAIPPEVPAALAPLYRPSVQPYLASWFQHDPALALARVPAALPVLIVNGTTDLQVPPAQGDLLFAARPAARRVVIEGMNHVLRLAPSGREANLATYADPSLPLAPDLLPAVIGFIHGPPGG